MERVLVLLIGLFSLPALAVVPSGVPQALLGGANGVSGGAAIAESSLSTYFTLNAGTQSSGANTYYVFYKNGTAYQVSSGKTAYCVSISSTSSSPFNTYQLVSSTTSWSNNVGSLPATAVYSCGGSNSYCLGTGTAAFAFNVMGATYQFSALTYPGIEVNQASTVYSVFLNCKEQ